MADKKDDTVSSFIEIEKLRKQTLGGSQNRMLNEAINAEFRAVARADDGLIKPESVVKQARNPRSILHPVFEWNDGKAADQYRLMQARYLIRSFKIELEPQVIVPAFVSISDDRKNRTGGGYRWTAEVYSEKDMRKRYVNTVLSDCASMLTRLEDEPEIVEPILDAIETARTMI